MSRVSHENLNIYSTREQAFLTGFARGSVSFGQFLASVSLPLGLNIEEAKRIYADYEPVRASDILKRVFQGGPVLDEHSSVLSRVIDELLVGRVRVNPRVLLEAWAGFAARPEALRASLSERDKERVAAGFLLSLALLDFFARELGEWDGSTLVIRLSALGSDDLRPARVLLLERPSLVEDAIRSLSLVSPRAARLLWDVGLSRARSDGIERTFNIKLLGERGLVGRRVKFTLDVLPSPADFLRAYERVSGVRLPEDFALAFTGFSGVGSGEYSPGGGLFLLPRVFIASAAQLEEFEALGLISTCPECGSEAGVIRSFSRAGRIRASDMGQCGAVFSSIATREAWEELGGVPVESEAHGEVIRVSRECRARLHVKPRESHVIGVRPFLAALEREGRSELVRLVAVGSHIQRALDNSLLQNVNVLASYEPVLADRSNSRAGGSGIVRVWGVERIPRIRIIQSERDAVKRVVRELDENMLVPFVASTGFAGELAPRVNGINPFFSFAYILPLVMGNMQEFKRSRTVRGMIHSLILGVPGTYKSSLARRLRALAERVEVLNASNITAPGVFVSVERVSGFNRVAIPGLIPRLREGVVVFDEFNTSSLLSEFLRPMEEGVVDVAKSQVQAAFDAFVSMVFIANPARFNTNSNPAGSLENFTFSLDPRAFFQQERFGRFESPSDAFLQRLDIILPIYHIGVVDKPIVRVDKPDVNTILKLSREGIIPLVGEDFMRAWFSEAREIESVNSESFEEYFESINAAYDWVLTTSNATLSESRTLGFHTNPLFQPEHVNPKRITQRAITSIKRLSEAIAKLSLRSQVEKRDVLLAMGIYTLTSVSAYANSLRPQLVNSLSRFLADVSLVAPGLLQNNTQLSREEVRERVRAFIRERAEKNESFKLPDVFEALGLEHTSLVEDVVRELERFGDIFQIRAGEYKPMR